MSDRYTAPERRRKPPILFVSDDLDGIREALSDHLAQEADMRAHFDAQLDDIRDLLSRQIEATKSIRPAVEELKSILTGFKFLKKTAIVVASVVGSLYAFWQAIKDHIRF